MKQFFFVNLDRIRSIKIIIFIGLILTFISSDIAEEDNQILASEYSQFIVAKLNQVAINITVKIWDDDFLGSGTIVGKQDNHYEIITNRHVLKIGDPPYRIQTPDGEFHQAQVIADTTKKSWDLAFLTFDSGGKNYKTAPIGNSGLLKIGDYVFATGFPGANQLKNLPELEKQNNVVAIDEQSSNNLTGLSFQIGRVSLVLDKPLTAGYQIGSTNIVKKGMSGGPLLNEQGQLVGINGKHAYPLWEAPEFYEDGSQTCLPIQELITKNSWSIPIEKVNSFYQEVGFLPPGINSEKPINFSLSLISLDNSPINPTEIVAKMQAKASSIIKCKTPK